MSSTKTSPTPTSGQEVWILDARRTPLAQPGGALSDLQPAALLAGLVGALCEPPSGAGVREGGLPLGALVLGCASEGGIGAGALSAALARAGAPARVAASLVEGGCEAGAEAIRLAAAGLRGGDARFALAGGLHLPARAHGRRAASPDVLGALAAQVVSPCTAADVAAALYAISPQEVLARTEALRRAGPPDAQTPVDASLFPVYDLNGLSVLPSDDVGGAIVAQEAAASNMADGSRPAQFALARQAWPELSEFARVHAPETEPPPLEGAGLLLLGRADAARELGLRPRARIVATASAGHRPLHTVETAVGAVDDALARAGWAREQLDSLAVAGRFRGLSLAIARTLGLDGGLADAPEDWWHGHVGAATPVLALMRLLRQLERAGPRRGALVCPGESGACVVVLLERGDHV